MLFRRTIQKSIEERLFKGKVVIIYGARQVGKTTLIEEIQKRRPEPSVLLNCDEPDIRAALTGKTSTELKSFIGNKTLVFIDEAQRVRDIGLTLKLLVDNFRHIQVVATGSSSFDLSNQVVEPLTGRSYEFVLYPLALEELQAVYSDIELDRLLERRMIYGLYPEIVQKENEAEVLLKKITRDYLYKDILQFQQIKRPEVLDKLLQALALQIGHEVSYNELAQTTGLNSKTVEQYIQLLEKAFIIFRLGPYSRNLRTELKKLRKIYFYDPGVRNALINNLNQLPLRSDAGNLWENFLMSERLKFLHNHGRDPRRYFWRTHQGAEIDYLEEEGGRVEAFEFKWGDKLPSVPKAFADAYPQGVFSVVHRKNYQRFLSEKAGQNSP